MGKMRAIFFFWFGSSFAPLFFQEKRAGGQGSALTKAAFGSAVTKAALGSALTKAALGSAVTKAAGVSALTKIALGSALTKNQNLRA